jgi:hypothetical protein
MECEQPPIIEDKKDKRGVFSGRLSSFPERKATWNYCLRLLEWK